MIEFVNVSKDYSSHVHALHHVNFLIEAGDFVFLIGESGAGKSTVIKLLTCEEYPTEGSVILDQYEISTMKKKLVPYLRRKIGLIFQDFRLIESKTVFENVAFAMEIVGAPRKLIERRVPIVLSLVGLRGKAEAYPQELSGGEAQRVGIARAMVNNPRLILADEPTGNLDQANGEAIMALLDEINRAGTTVIACTHDMETVQRMNKRVLELSEGRLVRDSKPEARTESDPSCFVTPDFDRKQLRQFLEDAGTPDCPEQIPELENTDNRGGSPGFPVAQTKTVSPDGGKTVLPAKEPLPPLPDLSQLKEQIDSDSKRRKHRLSLAERIARIRLGDDPDPCNAEQDPAESEESAVKEEENNGQ